MITLDEIKAVLPHRYPMLMLDRVLEHVPRERITVAKAITVNEPWYAAVTDGAPAEDYAYPYLMLVESWCHAAGVLCAWAERNPDVLAGRVMLFGSMTGVRFHRPVFPGDLVEHRVRLVKASGDTKICAGESVVGTELVAEYKRIVMAMRPASQLPPTPAVKGHHAEPAGRATGCGHVGGCG